MIIKIELDTKLIATGDKALLYLLADALEPMSGVHEDPATEAEPEKPKRPRGRPRKTAAPAPEPESSRAAPGVRWG